MIILGTTNTPEFGFYPITDSLLHGPAQTPYKKGFNAGGSSGGSAAAVAARLVPLASASDYGGSIRMPAACCGVFGLKPSRGRNPVGPVEGEIWLGLGVEHVLTRSVRDSAAVLDATCGADSGAPYSLSQPERPFLEAVERPPAGLRVAFSTESPVGTDVDPVCVEAVQETGRLLEELGHRVEEATPDRGGHPRRLFRVTSHGIAALRVSRDALIRLWEGLDGNIDIINHFFDILLSQYDASEGLDQLKAPVFLAMGRYDYAVPYHSWADVKEQFMNLSYNVFEKSGHYPMLEEQELFDKKLIDWIKSH